MSKHKPSPRKTTHVDINPGIDPYIRFYELEDSNDTEKWE